MMKQARNNATRGHALVDEALAKISALPDADMVAQINQWKASHH